MNNIEIIEAVYNSVTRWRVNDLVHAANCDLETKTDYVESDIATMYVRYNTIHIVFKDGCEYEEEGGYDHDIDWACPEHTMFWTEDYERVYSAEEKKDLDLKEAAPSLLEALVNLHDACEFWKTKTTVP